ncbi:Gx transporter family protein [Amantichitinum ursilacus]|uniref:Heptaprenyl diphosphate synthase component I n=1 Tax=Amantichitinum ursilacus TaxID=857265 RepID=A0A0N1JT86_9NEIS|nr:Gx transporter family protein [Amantichitinum ursilacus]KPC54038.1 Heptaprenyl diphosphate synthase component I [Amantichitinum ursilacus]
MTASATDPHAQTLTATAADLRIARYAAIAILLGVVEAGFPSPIPGVKPGIANIITLVVLWRYGWRDAAWVSLLRIFGGALVLGGFLSPGFALGLCGGLCSLAALGAAQYLPRRWFGPVSLSLIAAFAHIAGQLGLARLWLIPDNGIVRLAPVFFGAALLFGLANGLIAARLLRPAPEYAEETAI